MLALLALTRTFELVALLLAWLIALALLWLLQAPPPQAAARLAAPLGRRRARRDRGRRLCGHRARRDAFFLYGNHLDRQSGAVQAAEVAETPTFSPGLVPIKLVQLFVEPCFYAFVQRRRLRRRRRAGAAHSRSRSRRGRSVSGGCRWPCSCRRSCSCRSASSPSAGSSSGSSGHRERAAARVRELRLLLEMTIAATGIVVGYAASTMTGSPHLRYGFARDFLLPALLTGIVAVSLGSAGLWLALDRGCAAALVPRPSSCSSSVAIAGVVLLVAGVAVARDRGLPRFESAQLESVSYTATAPAECAA